MDWSEIWQTIKNFFTSNGLKILSFFLVLILGIIIVKILLNIFRRMLNKTKMEKIAMQFIITIMRFLLYLVLVLILLGMIGIQVSGIVTAISAILLAVGMALEDNIANLANGIVIVATHMFKKGDYIYVDDVEGSIIDINFLFTTLSTSDNKKITIPNSTIVNNSVTNSGANPTRRVDFTFSVMPDADVELVKKIIVEVMTSNGKVYLNPAPFCRLKEIGSKLTFSANCWCDREDYGSVECYVVENVYNEFKRHGVPVSYNQVEILKIDSKTVMPYIKDELPKRVEKVRKKEDHFDLETASFSDFIKHNKEVKRKKKEEKQNKLKNKNKNKSDEGTNLADESKSVDNVAESKSKAEDTTNK